MLALLLNTPKIDSRRELTLADLGASQASCNRPEHSDRSKRTVRKES
jgi:hypothetical protein